MCPTSYCAACDYEMRNPGFKSVRENHICMTEAVNASISRSNRQRKRAAREAKFAEDLQRQAPPELGYNDRVVRAYKDFVQQVGGDGNSVDDAYANTMAFWKLIGTERTAFKNLIHPYMYGFRMIVDDPYTGPMTQQEIESAKKWYEDIPELTNPPRADTKMEPRYALSDLWPYGRFVKPIKELSTPHLKNIKEYFKTGAGFKKLRENRELEQRVMNCLVELTRRSDSLRRKVNDYRIRIAGVLKRNNEGYFFSAPNNEELIDILKSIDVEILHEIQKRAEQTLNPEEHVSR